MSAEPERLRPIRCTACKKKLVLVRGVVVLSIKCPRCGKVNHG